MRPLVGFADHVVVTAVSPQRSFPARPDSVGRARAYVREVTAALPGPVRDNLALMVSELSTNAVLHGTGPFVVAVDCSDSDVVVTVTDHGQGRASLRDVAPLEPRGRGLLIVDELADDWGSERSELDETVVWFRVAVDPSERT